MRIAIILCCVAGVSMCGCTNTYQLWGESPETVSGHLQKLQGKTVDLALTNGTTHEDVTISFFGDSVGFQRRDPPLTAVVPITSVVTIRRSGSALGPILGLVGGLLIGGSIGAAAAVDEDEDHQNVGDAIGHAFVAPVAAAGGFMVGGSIGGAAGLTIGAVAGSGELYVLAPGPFSSGRSSGVQTCTIREIRATGDTVTVGMTSLLQESPTRITIRWRGGTVTLERPPVELIRTEGKVLLLVPEKLLN